MKSKAFKIIFSIAIIVASMPSVITDIREGFSGTYTHYGTLLIGISYFIESLFWVIEMWVNDLNKAYSDLETLDPEGLSYKDILDDK